MKNAFFWLIETLLRMFPFPTRVGLREIGNPGPDSPVLLTCNFHLTVLRVKRALRGTDAWLLVANSRGVNVWCSAAGGLFTEHDVISALKTTGIEDKVRHRRVILPQLAAAGVNARVIREKAGWQPIWGPVYARDIKPFLARGLKKDRGMSMVEFPLGPRLEMAIAWAFPISLIFSLVLLGFWREGVVVGNILIWGFSFAIYAAFPLYERFLKGSKKHPGLVFFDFGRGGLHIVLLALALAGVFAISALRGFSWGFVLRWGALSAVLVLILSMDILGSTPVYKSSLHLDRDMVITLDRERCRGASFCERVCPRGCYRVINKKAVLSPEGCVRCGACIVQCPFDAISFTGPDGSVVGPEVIRKYKLNMLGSRRTPGRS